jgi:phenylalanyl-tRNA synthetase beta chain
LLVPIGWIKEYIEVDLSPEELADALTMAGLESLSLASAAPDVKGVVTARIEKIEQHPNADKLTVCRVRPAEDAEPLTIVCGAPNISEGDIVPLAAVGTVLPDGTKLKKTKIRGETSHGMMCSQKELDVSDDHSGIWILPPGTPIGKTLPETLGLSDAIIETEPTPNRGDLQSIIGVAREIAAITGKQAKLPGLELVETGPDIAGLTSVDIEDYAGCPRYVARLVRGLKVGPSPEWMVERLEACGMRPINNVVDATNFVMLEMGQPLHAFDFNRLREKRIVVKRAKHGDKFTTLDGQERALRDDTLMICDGAGPVAIAGVMGGLDSEVSERTADVLIESAYFKPADIRRTARILGIPTEASRRFDKGVDPLGTAFAADRAAALMKEISGGEICKGLIDARDALFQKKRITLRPERTGRILGVELSVSEQKQILKRLDSIEVEEKDGLIEVVAPSYRPDLLEEHDLIEEIARLRGYDSIPSTMPGFTMEPMRRSPFQELASSITECMAALGFSQVILTSFEDPQRLGALGLPDDDPRRRAVKPRNPLSENESILRTTLVPKLLSCLAMNLSRGFTDEVRIYEINAVFEDGGEELPVQRTMLAALISPPRDKSLWSMRCNQDGFYDIKGVVEQVLSALGFPGARIEPDPSPDGFLHPGKAARVMTGKSCAGKVGEINPVVAESMEISKKVFIFEISFDMLVERAGYVPRAAPVSKFPPALRDIAIVVDEAVAMQDIIRAARKLKSPGVEAGMALFDVFRGGAVPQGKKSMAFHVRYQAMDRTLTDDEVGKEHQRLAEQLEKAVGATLR